MADNHQTSEIEEFFSIWRINTRTQKFLREQVPQSWEQLGGRALLARIMLDEVIPTCEALGPNNKLVFTPGLLVGHKLSSFDRISIGAKSPLTGGIKESNAGGQTGLQLTHLGIKALIIEDQPEETGTWILHLSAAGAVFEEAGELAGKGVFETAALLLERYGEKAAIALIGPGGEMRLPSAGIQNLDKDRSPTRIAARGGLGAVMGSKGLKAVVIDSSGGSKPPIFDPESFHETRKEYVKALQEHPQTGIYNDFGTIAMTAMTNSYGAIPTNNFSKGQFDGASKIGADFMRERLLNRGGEANTSHACMAGCIIRCSNIYADVGGKAVVTPLEYETVGLLGSNLGIDDLDKIAEMNAELNDLGLDTIEIGASLGVAAEARLMEFGDGARALELVNEIREGTPLGRILGSGPGTAGKVLGIERVPVVKNQAISAYDPRTVKGTGVTYATSPQGADHTAGLTIRADIDHLSPEGQVEVSRAAQFKTAGYDVIGACTFAGFGVSLAPHVISELLNARYGWETGDNILVELGRECIKLERQFNKLAGFTSADDRLPEWMTREPLPPHNAVFDVPYQQLDSTFDW